MQENILKAQKELALREKARRDFKTFLYLKWQRYDKKDFLHNWHFEYLTNVLTHTIPKYCKDKNQSLLTRIMLNMPPSYGKTETYQQLIRQLKRGSRKGFSFCFWFRKEKRNEQTKLKRSS